MGWAFQLSPKSPYFWSATVREPTVATGTNRIGSAIVSYWSGLFGDRNTPQEVVRRHQDQYLPAMTDDAGDCVSRRQEPAAEQALVLSVGEEGQIQALDRRPA